MPNWCNNTVEIFHEDPAMIERVRKAFDAGALLNEFIPCPAELHEHEAPIRSDELAKRFMEQYGATDWYNWQVQNWGTKWDIGADGQPADDSDNGGLILSFDSAWSPPIGAYETLSELGFQIRAYYYEPGMAFAGIWEDGNDDFYESGGMNSEQSAEELPEALDEMFNISDDVAMWEEENQEIDLDGGLSAINEQEELK
jgi:hypothetical protein